MHLFVPFTRRSAGTPFAAHLWVLFAATFSNMASGERVTQPHLQLEMVAEHRTLQPGRPARVGVYFEIEPGWHLYWVNPGDSGRSPHTNWEVPPGFSLGPPVWPSPSRVPFGRLMNYGYERRLLLAYDLRVPAEGLTAHVVLGGRVDWLVCAEECIPGKIDLRMELPVADTPPVPSEAAPLFKAADDAYPRPLPESSQVTAYADQEQLVFRIEGVSLSSDAYFFPLESQLLRHAAPQKVGHDGVGTILTTQRSDKYPDLLARARGVLETGGKSYLLDVAVIPRPRSGVWKAILAGIGLVLAGWFVLKRRNKTQ